MTNDYVYLDNAATTRVLPEAVQAAGKYFSEEYFNPSALYGKAIQVSRAVKLARSEIASILGVEEDCICFTSSGTESDNQALFCSRKRNGSKIIISAAEHAAVYNSAAELKQRGYEIAICPVDGSGRVIIEEFEKLVDERTSLVSVMHVCNLSGAINDISQLVRITRKKAPDALFHSDGVQAFCKIPVKLRSLDVDFYSVSSHKVGAPKGSGFLYVKKGVHIAPLLFGGGQERGLRSSTENTSAIVGFGCAAKHSAAAMPALNQKGSAFFGEVITALKQIDNLKMLSLGDCAPHILAFTMRDVRGEVLMHSLEDKGFITGIGSACSSKKGLARLPAALGLGAGYNDGIIRLSINAYDNYDAKAFVAALGSAVDDLKKYVRV